MMNMNNVKNTAFAITVFLMIIGVVHAGSYSNITNEKMTIKMAIDQLTQGNTSFADNKLTLLDGLPGQIEQVSKGQNPFAAIVSCLDSRIPPEIVFNQGLGELFVARVAGNFVNDDILGSIEFAAIRFPDNTNLKLIVVMGHTDCGAIAGACSAAVKVNGGSVDDTTSPVLLAITLDNIKPAVWAVPDGPSMGKHFVKEVTKMNVRLTMQKVLDRSQVLRNKILIGQIALI